MIIPLQQAQRFDPNITQDQLDGFEASIRQITSNNFQVKDVRGHGITIAENVVSFKRDLLTKSVRVGDTIEIYGAGINDGLYTIKDVNGLLLTLDVAPRVSGVFREAIASLVVYPADVKVGIENLIKYDVKMGSKIGVKSETVSRMSTTYYDVNSAESTSGYPANLMNFIKKYEKMRWG